MLISIVVVNASSPPQSPYHTQCGFIGSSSRSRSRSRSSGSSSIASNLALQVVLVLRVIPPVIDLSCWLVHHYHCRCVKFARVEKVESPNPGAMSAPLGRLPLEGAANNVGDSVRAID